MHARCAQVLARCLERYATSPTETVALLQGQGKPPSGSPAAKRAKQDGAGASPKKKHKGAEGKAGAAGGGGGELGGGGGSSVDNLSDAGKERRRLALQVKFPSTL